MYKLPSFPSSLAAITPVFLDAVAPVDVNPEHRFSAPDAFFGHATGPEHRPEDCNRCQKKCENGCQIECQKVCRNKFGIDAR